MSDNNTVKPLDEDKIRKGWISLYRSMKDNILYPNNRELTKYEAWIEMLLSVNHTDREIQLGYEVYICKRGESLQSLDTWARVFGWHKSKVRRFFNMLVKNNMIVIKSTHKTTHLKVVQYSVYQNTRHNADTITTRSRHVPDTLPTLNNNSNKFNNDNNERDARAKILKFFQKNGIKRSTEADKFYYHYKAQGWTYKGNYFDWKAKALEWIARMPEFNNGSDQGKTMTPGAAPKEIKLSKKGYPLKPNVRWSEQNYDGNKKIHTLAVKFWESKGYVLKRNSLGSVIWFTTPTRTV